VIGVSLEVRSRSARFSNGGEPARRTLPGCVYRRLGPELMAPTPQQNRSLDSASGLYRLANTVLSGAYACRIVRRTQWIEAD
jgi:hypothetical protein